MRKNVCVCESDRVWLLFLSSMLHPFLRGARVDASGAMVFGYQQHSGDVHGWGQGERGVLCGRICWRSNE
jgi:hypothetical protein